MWKPSELKGASPGSVPVTGAQSLGRASRGWGAGRRLLNEHGGRCVGVGHGHVWDLSSTTGYFGGKRGLNVAQSAGGNAGHGDGADWPPNPGFLATNVL